VPESIRIDVAPGESVTALLYPAASPDRMGTTLVLAPGAGAGQLHELMVGFATALAARGIDALTFDFLYAERGRRLPDRNDRLEACYGAVIAAVRDHARLGRNSLAIGGKSMGGRIASQVAARGVGGLAGLVLLGYPLHSPGKPDLLRAKHLLAIATPMLFVQGARDAFGTPDELRPIIAKLAAPAALHVVAGGDHSFKVAKRSGVAQRDVYAAIQDGIAAWLRETVAALPRTQL
jgi:predicted alpha/beta-hydrolase family hydrolase